MPNRYVALAGKLVIDINYHPIPVSCNNGLPRYALVACHRHGYKRDKQMHGDDSSAMHAVTRSYVSRAEQSTAHTCHVTGSMVSKPTYRKIAPSHM